VDFMGNAKTLIIYGAFVFGLLLLFLFGCFIVNIPVLKEKLNLTSNYSIWSGLSFVFWPILGILFFRWLKVKKYAKIIREKSLVVSTVILVIFSMILYPPIMFLFGYWDYPILTQTLIALSYAIMTAFAGFQVFLLGLNSNYRGDSKKRDEIIKFLIASTTLVSLSSVALTFVLSRSDYLVAMSTTYQRAVVAGAYCLIPIATYCLGYLAKLMRLAVAEGVGLVLSLILSFVIGTSVLSVISWNWFVFSAIIPLFLIVGLILSIYEKSNGLSNLSE
jgi:hypothetical protein